MPQLLGFALLALVPGLLWLWYFYRRDKAQPEPLAWVLGTFALGVVAVFPALIVEQLLQNFWQRTLPHGTQLFFAANFFLNVAPVEEYLKFYVVFRFVYQHRPFNQPAHGLIYASAAALGFAAAENLIYMYQVGWQVIFLRGFLTSLAHVLFAAMWGIALVQARFHPEPMRPIGWGLLLAILTHGLYNFLLAAHLYGGFLFLLGLLSGLGLYSQRWLKQGLQEHS